MVVVQWLLSSGCCQVVVVKWLLSSGCCLVLVVMLFLLTPRPQKCQHDIGHPLPLGSDLLEPVQRVLRYHILLKKIVNNLREEENGYKEVKVSASKCVF